MAKRVQKDGKANIAESTQFQLHKSQMTEFAEFMRSTYDFTEHKLKRYVDSIDDDQKKQIFEMLLIDYIKGNVAIAWRRGEPLHINVIKA